MLDELIVHNLGLIERAELTLGPGLVAVTGETGAGKTLLVGALRLLRGEPARSDRVGPTGDEARVEGRFITTDGEITAARRLGHGRSRAYLDGSAVPAAVLADRVGDLVELVAQHDHLSLGREASLRAVVDGSLDGEGLDAAVGYRSTWTRLEALRADLAALGGDRKALIREHELALYQVAEIEAAGLEMGEDARLAADLARFRHAGDIAEALADAHRGLVSEDGIAPLVGPVVDALRRAERFDSAIGPLAERMAALAVEIDEAARDTRVAADAVAHEPAALESAEQRAALHADLKRKYGDSIEEVMAYGNDAATHVERLSALVERAGTIDAEVGSASEAVVASGERLRAARVRSAKSVGADALGHLTDLGFDDPTLDIAIEPIEAAPHGTDRIRLRFSSTAALAVGPLSRVASGGELSRIVLAVRLAAGVADAPVVAFDEIDAGLGGATALAMGRKLASLARGRQVLVVTHLPQVAAHADSHFVVHRSGSIATVTRVEGDARAAEIARMLSGLAESDQGLAHAEELLETAARR